MCKFVPYIKEKRHLGGKIDLKFDNVFIRKSLVTYQKKKKSFEK